MTSTQLHITLGQSDPDRSGQSVRLANDNFEREQELFERAASREGAGEDD